MSPLNLFSRGSGNVTEIGSRHVQLMGRALWFLLACALLGCHSDRRESFYPSLSDAKKDGAIDRGWIPDFLPESSRSIHELHDISPSMTWCAFEFLPTDISRLKKQLEAGSRSLSSVTRVPNPRKSWWPSVLTGDLDTAKIHGAEFEIYVLVEPETASTNAVLLFAVDWAQGRGFFFRKPLP